MSTIKKQPETKDEEIDLGKLFELIGKGFTRFYNFIASIFISLFHAIIFILLFFRKNAIVFALSIIIGGAIGYFVQRGHSTYSSSMTVKPNFNSIRQLYENVNYFNNLAEQGDSTQLAAIFKIKTSEAANLKSFKINPIITNKYKLSIYNKFVKKSDTSVVKETNFEDFVEKLTPFDYVDYTIAVESGQKDVFLKLTKGIVNSLNTNNYLINLKNTSLKNLDISESFANTNLQHADSLYGVYSNVLLKEAEKPFTGTSIQMSSKEKAGKELELFAIKNGINKQLNNINKERTENEEVVHIISNFNKVGEKESFVKTKPGKYALVLFILTLFVLLGIKLNKYLKNYEVE